jgi:hypothetical protein
MGEKKGPCRVLVRKPERKKPLGKPRHRWEDNITIDLRSWNGAWTGLIWLCVDTGGGHL